MVPERKYKIGEVISMLSWQYPEGITAGAIRFWENKGLLEPSEKTDGGHRLYTEESIEWIRFLKELSLAGYSIEEMRKELEKVRGRIEDVKGKSGARKESMKYFRRLIETRRRRNTLDTELELLSRLDDLQRTEKVYDTEALIRILGGTRARRIIEKAEQYGLAIPKEIEGVKRFSANEEMILKILSFMEFLEPGAVEQCRDLVPTVRYLTKKVGIYEGFVGDRKHDGTTGYNATLYTLVLQNLDSMRLIE